MHKNVGMLDRRVRGLIVAPVLLVVAWALGFSTILGLVALALAVVMAATAAVGFCPLYALLRFQTARHPDAHV